MFNMPWVSSIAEIRIYTGVPFSTEHSTLFNFQFSNYLYCEYIISHLYVNILLWISEKGVAS